jgi:hypothetical protein
MEAAVGDAANVPLMVAPPEPLVEPDTALGDIPADDVEEHPPLSSTNAATVMPAIFWMIMGDLLNEWRSVIRLRSREALLRAECLPTAT